MGRSPREAAGLGAPAAPASAGEDRTYGWGVMGLPLQSGDYLALRSWTASSFGPPYSSVWRRDPRGRWTIYADQPPEVSCARFVGAAAHRTITSPVRLTWADEAHLKVEVEDLRWRMTLVASPATRTLTGCGSLLPEAAWANPTVLRLMGRLVSPLLATGPLRLAGTMPCGQFYRMAARRTWLVAETSVEVAGRPLGHELRPDAPVTIGDVLLPARGVFFADATARFTAPAPHPGVRATQAPSTARRPPKEENDDQHRQCTADADSARGVA